jgi:deazaflavin-dependent oxidoreductase (nitroreductase family)
MSDWNEKVIEEFRANGGKVGGVFKNMTLLLLHTTGAKSGQPRINPLATMTEGSRQVIIASKGGADTHPDWYYNLVANPDVTVEYGEDIYAARANIVEEPARSELFAKMAAKYPVFAEYEHKAKRVIPVIALERYS